MNTNTMNFDVSGMKCEHCVAKVRDTLKQITGVVTADVDLAKHTASVTGSADPAIVVETLTAVGFPTKPMAG